MLRLTDEQWERIREHFPEENFPSGRPGRKPIPTRKVLEAVLWILNTGAQWHMLPQGYPNYKTVHRRFQQWREQEVLRDVLTDLANSLVPMLFAAFSFAVAQHNESDTLPADPLDFIRSHSFAGYADLRAAYDSSATPRLLEMLNSTTDDRERRRAAGVLSVVGDERAVDPLIALLERSHSSELSMEDEEARREALMALGFPYVDTYDEYEIWSEGSLSHMVYGNGIPLGRQYSIVTRSTGSTFVEPVESLLNGSEFFRGRRVLEPGWYRSKGNGWGTCTSCSRYGD